MNEIQNYREVLEWVRDVHPGASPDSVEIHISWDEWNAMRALLDLPLQSHCKIKDIGA